VGDPTKKPQADTGVEVWATGSWAELERVRAQLGAAGVFAQDDAPKLVAAGRYRAYWRLRLRSA
jgi:hypothetical protein